MPTFTQRAKYLIFKQKAEIFFISLYALINIYLIYTAVSIQDNDTVNIYLKITRASSECIKFHAALILLPILRNVFTWLRRTFRHHAFPLEHPIGVHKYLGHALFTLVLIHIAGYMSYYATLPHSWVDTMLGSGSDLVRAMKTNMYEYVTFDESIDEVQAWIDDGFSEEVYEKNIKRIMWDDCTDCHSLSSTITEAFPELPLSTYEDVVRLGGKGYGGGTMSRKSWIHLVGALTFLCFGVLWFFALGRLRRNYHHLFYLTHYLFILWFIGIMVHAPETIVWVLFPCAIFIIDKTIHYTIRRKKTNLTKAELVSSNTVKLTLNKPASFKYYASDVIFIRIPELLGYEWHPFTISSAPSNKDMTLRIRNSGDWTEKLCEMSQQNPEKLTLPILIHGPYSTPTLNILNAKVPVLIATDIGATPFAGVIQEWLNLLKENNQKAKTVQKLIFVWIYPNQDARLWMKELLEEMEDDSLSDLLEVHLYQTKPNPNEEIQSPVSHIKNLKGRPVWDDLFNELASKYTANKLEIYYCGNQAAAKAVKHNCLRHHLTLYRERF